MVEEGKRSWNVMGMDGLGKEKEDLLGWSWMDGWRTESESKKHKKIRDQTGQGTGNGGNGRFDAATPKSDVTVMNTPWSGMNAAMRREDSQGD